MGRWSQRRRSGGGPPASLIQMTLVDVFIFDDLDITYSAAIDAGDFDPGTFESTPSGQSGIIVGQQAANKIRVTFPGPINADNTLDYTGLVPGILTPQTIGF